MGEGERTSVTLPSRPPYEPLQPAGLAVHAPAKINLNLLVGPKRDDGYHDLDSLVARITLYDRIELRPRDDADVTLTCSGFDCGRDEDNLARRAAGVVARGRDVGGVDIMLVKNIPPGRGLGGGSSDAAGVLVGLNELWRLSLKRGQLGELAAELGSDVPLFLGPPAARMTGRGEHLEAVEVHDFAAVLVLPDFSCRTATVYEAFDADPPTRGGQLSLEALRRPPSRWRGLLVNQLQDAAASVCGPIKKMTDTLRSACDVPVCMTGSGSAVFILCDDEDEAAQVISTMPEPLRRQSVVVRSNPW